RIEDRPRDLQHVIQVRARYAADLSDEVGDRRRCLSDLAIQGENPVELDRTDQQNEHDWDDERELDCGNPSAVAAKSCGNTGIAGLWFGRTGRLKAHRADPAHSTKIGRAHV